jgi:hypothetical protein
LDHFFYGVLLEEQLNLEQQKADAAQQQLEVLLAQMRSLGIKPDQEI